MLFSAKRYDDESVFRPENLLRESRRQKKIVEGPVPHVCVLDPDGDIHALLKRRNETRIVTTWACYHTVMSSFRCAGRTIGIIPGVIGSSFAVLVAEQLRVSGCLLILSITSAGKLRDAGPYRYLLISHALRDEGTSYHYLEPHEKAGMLPRVEKCLSQLCADPLLKIGVGCAWTTDAPYRESSSAIQAASDAGAKVVEMESAALYAFGMRSGIPVVCFAHLTNSMGTCENDFEKGEMNGALESLRLMERVIDCIYSGGILSGETI
jgi:uridine phosphorylase